MLSVNCSNLARVMQCSGSLFFKDLPKEPQSEAAKEGVAAGECLEHYLNGKNSVPTHARNGVLFDDDMLYHAQEAANEIEPRATGKIDCEKRIDWRTLSGIWIKGKADASYIMGEDLCVDDYKYGWGLVEAEENWQLLAYAIGEVIQRNMSFTNIILRIWQPRPHHEDGPIREWRITYEELLKYKQVIEDRMMNIFNGEKGLMTGTSCKYCPAASACPAFNKSFYRGVEVTHDFIQDGISDDELSFQLDMLERIGEVFKIKKSSLEALAISRIASGSLVPNWIMEKSYGNRKWLSTVNPDVVKMMTGKDIIQKSMLSPAKAEKLGVSKDFVKRLVSRPFLGQKLKRCDTKKMGNKIFGKQ